MRVHSNFNALKCLETVSSLTWKCHEILVEYWQISSSEHWGHAYEVVRVFIPKIRPRPNNQCLMSLKWYFLIIPYLSNPSIFAAKNMTNFVSSHKCCQTLQGFGKSYQICICICTGMNLQSCIIQTQIFHSSVIVVSLLLVEWCIMN